jgi:DNA-binding response OmpR family regulator
MDANAAAPAVLLLDPDDDGREMYALGLASCGFCPIAVDNAEEALGKVPGTDLLVTGIGIHGSFDGLELLRRVRSTDAGKPVIVLTAYATEFYRLQAQQAGCDAFLTKPCPPDTLACEIRRLLSMSRDLREQSRQVRTRAANAINRSNHLLEKLRRFHQE